MFVGPPRAQALMWWTSQLSAAWRQSGTGHVVSVARARSRCLVLAKRWGIVKIHRTSLGVEQGRFELLAVVFCQVLGTRDRGAVRQAKNGLVPVTGKDADVVR